MATSEGGSRKLLWLLVILVVMSLAVTASALFMLFTQQGGMEQAQAEEHANVEYREPIFVEINPFTVNLAEDDHGARLLYAGISLKVTDTQSRELLEAHMPQVRSRLLTLLSGRQAADLTSADGKKRLADEIIATLEAPMEKTQPELAIEDVLFTEFIVQ
ncbi:flagellar basal body-associated protein FliL [Halomonas elongata]|uniref:Flagellar protein FliL n=2 Tax=Halomonas elongata TaxID=2746 RepID=E1VC79_HALED|nr:flagellar basal body-associated protein FliL [Halomonas elongata]MBW5800232.1 flagellar basal body-associated protein FliL [Halomonas elongata]OBX35398.1 flagellar basal body-associated protein FliL [Halomonas elongata]RAW07104.1 flagellar basal body-associated protein FliL [Halomonas elongata]WBF18015.1 flagellar basal body-associated protein FliL [Halomonas elongata]WPU46864.1 flagellar basal body-associated protein FliL [Halomonas elongata DSM 2581]